VFLHDGKHVVCLDRGTGEERWRSSPLNTGRLSASRTPRLVVYEQIVLLSDGRRVTALSARTGESLWTGNAPPTGHASPGGLLVAGEQVCFGRVPNRYNGIGNPVFDGLDPATGAKKNSCTCPFYEEAWTDASGLAEG